MRDLRTYGSFVGGVGLMMLSAQDTENKIAEVMGRKCKDCGQSLRLHHVDATGVTCPPVVMGIDVDD